MIQGYIQYFILLYFRMKQDVDRMGYVVDIDERVRIPAVKHGPVPTFNARFASYLIYTTRVVRVVSKGFNEAPSTESGGR